MITPFALLFSLFTSVPPLHPSTTPLCSVEELHCDSDVVVPAIEPAISGLTSDGESDWLQFSNPVNGSDVSLAAAPHLAVRWRIELPETAEGSPAFISNVRTGGDFRDLLIVSTINGRLLAIDPQTAETVWATTPPDGPRWSTSSPAVDPNRVYVYVYCLDGYVHRHDLRTGEEVRGDGWPELVTLKGDVEKGSSALAVATDRKGDSYLYVTTAGYPDPGDAGDYQGHLVTINLRTGVQNIFNAACSDRPIHFVENGGPATDCVNVQAGIWARAGAVFDAKTDRLFVTTGNGVFDAQKGGFDWGTSVVALHPDGSVDSGTPLDSWTPANFQQLTDDDLDLSSTTVAPLILPDGDSLPPLAVQGGKDERLRLLDLSNLSGQGGPRHIGGELQVIDLPQGGQILTRPAVWLQDGTSYVAVATENGVSVFDLVRHSGRPQLEIVWSAPVPSTSPVYANGVLFCAHSGVLHALDAATGNEVWSDHSLAPIHWQSPIIVGDSVFICDATGLTAYTLQQ